MAEEIPFESLVSTLKEIDDACESAKATLRGFAQEVKQAGDYSAEADRSVSQWANQCRSLSEEQKKVRKSIKEVSDATDLWKEGMSIETAPLNALKEQVSTLTKEFNRMGKEERELLVNGKTMATDISLYSRRIKELKDELKYGTKNMSEMKKAGISLADVFTSGAKSGKAMALAGRALGDAMGGLPQPVQAALMTIRDMTLGFKSLKAAMGPVTLALIAIQGAVLSVSAVWSHYREEVEKMKEFNDRITESASGQIAKLTILRSEWDNLKDTQKKSMEHMGHFQKGLEDLGVSAGNFKDINNALVVSFDRLKEAMLQRAYIAAYTEEIQKSVKAEISLDVAVNKGTESFIDQIKSVTSLGKLMNILGDNLKHYMDWGKKSYNQEMARKDLNDKRNAQHEKTISLVDKLTKAEADYHEKMSKYSLKEKNEGHLDKDNKQKKEQVDTLLKKLKDLGVTEEERLNLERDINAEYDVGDDRLAKINSKYDKLIASVQNEKLLHLDTSKLTKEQLGVYEKDLALSKSITDELEKQREHDIEKAKAEKAIADAKERQSFLDKTKNMMSSGLPSSMKDYLSASEEYHKSAVETENLLKKGVIAQEDANRRKYADQVSFASKMADIGEKMLQDAVNIYNKELEYKIKVEQEKEKLLERQANIANDQLTQQLELARQGYANDAASAQAMYDRKEKAIEESNKKVEELQKAEKISNEIMEVSNMVLAIAKLFAFNPVAAPALSGIMITGYLAAKAAAIATASHGEGTLQMIGGGSHASGHDTPVWYENGITHRAERGEYMAVINKRMSERYKNEIPELFNAINTGTYVPIGYRPPGKVDLTPTNGYLARIATAEEGRKTVTFRPDGSREERTGSYTKIYR